MKKNVIVLLTTIILVNVIIGCASTSEVILDPSEITYKEIIGEEYCNQAGSYNSYNSAEQLRVLYSETTGYKVLNVFIKGAETEELNGAKETLLKISAPINGNEQQVYATDFVNRMKQEEPDWAERVDTVANNEKYNGHYTLYLYEKKEGDWFNGYTIKVILYNIEGIPTKEHIEAEKVEAERDKAEKEAKEAKEKSEKMNALNQKGRILAKGYVYHGIDEVSNNCKLFVNGALEEGHAYYISGVVVKYGGSMAKIEYGDGLFFSSQSSAVYIDYANQKVKGEVVEAGIENLFGQEIEIPLTVVIAADKGYLHTPVVLGIIKDSEE